MRRLGRKLGMIAVSSNSLRKDALLLIVIQARIKARITDNADAPRAKMKEVKTSW
jgi:hypothetical protein